MENTGKEMSPLVANSKCPNCSHNLNFTVNVPDELAKIGREFREQVAALEEEKKNLEEELAKMGEGPCAASGAVSPRRRKRRRRVPKSQKANKASEGPSAASGAVFPIQGDDETHKLLEKIRTLETETEKLKAENEELQKMSTLKEERAKSVLKTARAKIQKCEDEKKKLEMEIGQAAAAEEQDHQLTAIMSELKLTKEKLENDLFAAQQEKEMLEEQVKNLEHGHRPTQTASICPMAQRTTSQAVVLPTCQMSPEVATVQPSVSVSPEEDNVGIASKEAEEAGTSVEKGLDGKMTNLQRPKPLKRKASDTGENLLVSQQKKHKMFLTMIGCGLSQLIQDEDTPARMLGPLEALKHNTTLSYEDEDVPS